jgi:hypothetical protein
MKTRHMNEVVRDMFRRWPTPEEKRREQIALRNKWMRIICKNLGIEYRPMDENGEVRR